MIARLVISPSLEARVNVIEAELKKNGLTKKHPDLLYIEKGQKLGIAEARKIKEHFSLKPYSGVGRAVVLEDAGIATVEAQNALLKTLEELTTDATLILGADSDANFLQTVLSRCQVIHLQGPTPTENENLQDVEKLINSTTEEQFQYIEKLKDKEELLHNLVSAFRKMLHEPNHKLTKQEITDFLKELLQAEQWAKQNVNIRAILEYLMLRMPTA